ncbi:hypothetical protein AB0K05_43430 [Nonomuraea sp. NPDC049486]|uniref:hypothetical protein n=1 Tax=unclassified Nonomuraea TaxID=2593643 RepID=UPI00342846FC
MRRFVLAVVTATLAALITAPPAAARTAAPDPVRALQKQLKAERGVKLSELIKGGIEDDPVHTRAKGGVQLSPSGPVATYVSMENVTGEPGTSEMLGFERHLYLGGEGLAMMLPPGKLWVKTEAVKGTGPLLPTLPVTQQPINVFDPAVLKATLKGERPQRVSGGYLYSGVVTYKELYEASKAYYGASFDGVPGAAFGKRTVDYRLWTDGAGLIKRLRTSKKTGWVTTADTRYTDWGHFLVITPPAEDEVLPFEDLNDKITEPGMLRDGLLGLR